MDTQYHLSPLSPWVKGSTVGGSGLGVKGLWRLWVEGVNAGLDGVDAGLEGVNSLGPKIQLFDAYVYQIFLME